MRILVAYDGSPYANAAVESLKRSGLPPVGEAMVVCVADEGWPIAKGGSGQHAGGFATSWAERLHEAEELAKRGCQRFEAAFPGWTATPEALWGSAPKAILNTVEWWKPDLLVVGSHGRSSAARLVLGSVSLALVHHAPCPVRVVRWLRR